MTEILVFLVILMILSGRMTVTEYVTKADANYIEMKSVIEGATRKEVERHILLFESNDRA